MTSDERRSSASRRNKVARDGLAALAMVILAFVLIGIVISHFV